MVKKLFLYFIIIGGLFTFNSCKTLYSNAMLKTPRDFKFNEIKKTALQEFKIGVHDVISFSLFSNDGFKVIDLNSFIAGEKGTGVSFIVELDGTIKLPILGRISLLGMTAREAEIFLEEKFSEFYVKPFVMLKVNNRKVILFPGAEGNAKIVPLPNTSTTLIELLASVGGIPNDGKAYSIKLIRGNIENPEVYLIDFSTLEGVQKGNMLMQSNDIVYVESRPRIANKLLTEMLPYFSIINTFIIASSLFRSFK
jgi:polysaccharide export outer membrane protein